MIKMAQPAFATDPKVSCPVSRNRQHSTAGKSIPRRIDVELFVLIDCDFPILESQPKPPQRVPVQNAAAVLWKMDTVAKIGPITVSQSQDSSAFVPSPYRDP